MDEQKIKSCKKVNKLRLITKPYSLSGKLFDAYDDTFSMVDDNDWVCFMDGDTAFLEMSDFGHRLQDYIDLYPETGMFTCYATRCHYSMQTRMGVNSGVDSIKYYAEKSIQVSKLHPNVKQMNRRVAGHLLMLKKSVWVDIRDVLIHKSKGKKILGFDTKLSYSLLEKGYDIKVMRGILVFHYLRFLTGKNTKIK